MPDGMIFPGGPSSSLGSAPHSNSLLLPDPQLYVPGPSVIDALVIIDPADLSVVIAGPGPTLSWSASQSVNVSTYSVFRRSPPTGAPFDPLVDIPVATGVTSPYVDTGATGSCEWEVFGEVVWTPASLSGLKVLADMSTATITSSSGLVSQVDDQSGQGNHLKENAAPPHRPTTGSHTINSKNVLWFDFQQLYIVADLGLTQPFTIFCVFRPLDTGTQRVADTYAGGRALLNPTGGQSGLYAGTAANVSALAANVAVAEMGLFNGASSKLQVDGTLTTGLNPGTNGFGKLIVGDDTIDGFGGAISKFDLAHIAVCSGDQSADFTNYRTWSQTAWATA